MSFVSSDVKAYVRTEKLRLIAAAHFFYDKRRAVIYNLFGRGRLSPSRIDDYLLGRGITPTQNEIDRAIDYVFTPPYSEGRFNKGTFAACYTAKEVDTCLEEKRFYLQKKGSPGFDYVVYSVILSGRLVDLRKTIASSRWVMPVEHEPCKEVGAQVQQRGYDGVAAPSARKVGGNCCAIFTRKALQSGEMVEDGKLTI